MSVEAITDVTNFDLTDPLLDCRQQQDRRNMPSDTVLPVFEQRLGIDRRGSATLYQGVGSEVLGGLELLHTERYQLGEISSHREVAPHSVGIRSERTPRAVYEVAVQDPYVEDYPLEVRARVEEAERKADAFARNRREHGAWQREPGQAYYDHNNVPQDKTHIWGDPVSKKAFFGALNSPALDAWLTRVPESTALRYLSDPKVLYEVVGKDGQAHPVDGTTKTWLALCTDAIAIRSRATVMANVVRDFALQRKAEGQGDDGAAFRWMSVACGTALPAMKAALHAGVKPELVLADLDATALSSTAEIAAEIGFDGSIKQHRINIFDHRQLAKLGEKLDAEGGRPELIDMMGIFEYTGKNIKVDPAAFLRANYDLLAPGGRLVFGQMRSDRPVPDFTTGVVSWPYVEMRTPDEFMAVMQEAGIAPETAQLYLPTDGVYTIGVIDKPLS